MLLCGYKHIVYQGIKHSLVVVGLLILSLSLWAEEPMKSNILSPIVKDYTYSVGQEVGIVSEEFVLQADAGSLLHDLQISFYTANSDDTATLTPQGQAAPVHTNTIQNSISPSTGQVPVSQLTDSTTTFDYGALSRTI